MSNNKETIADIVSKMRDFADGQEKNNCYDLREMGTDSLRAYADRIEEAAKRERGAGEESLQVVNAAVMRDALVETQSVIAKCMDILNKIPDGCEYDGLVDEVADELCDLRESHVKEALSAPPRNCDKYKTLDDARNAFFAEYVQDDTCSSATAFAIWLFDEAEGEAK